MRSSECLMSEANKRIKKLYNENRSACKTCKKLRLYILILISLICLISITVYVYTNY